jgi:hypothetical protein
MYKENKLRKEGRGCEIREGGCREDIWRTEGGLR